MDEGRRKSGRKERNKKKKKGENKKDVEKKRKAGTMKDTWAKSRGRVEVGEGGGFSWGGVEGWGEKAYNCN